MKRSIDDLGEELQTKKPVFLSKAEREFEEQKRCQEQLLNQSNPKSSSSSNPKTGDVSRHRSSCDHGRDRDRRGHGRDRDRRDHGRDRDRGDHGRDRDRRDHGRDRDRLDHGRDRDRRDRDRDRRDLDHDRDRRDHGRDRDRDRERRDRELALRIHEVSKMKFDSFPPIDPQDVRTQYPIIEAILCAYAACYSDYY